MKALLKIIPLLLILSLLFSCTTSGGSEETGDSDATENEDAEGSNSNKENTEFTMKAKILRLGEKLEVEIIESEYSSGIFHIILSDKTEIYNSDGVKIDKSDLTVDDVIVIVYSGQIMMSYPAQTVAIKITVEG